MPVANEHRQRLQMMYVLELLKIAMDDQRVESEFARRFGSYGKELVAEGLDMLKEVLDE